MSPFGLFHELLHGLRVLEGLGDEVVGEEVRVLRDGTHVVPGVAVVAAPAVDVFPRGHLVFNRLHESRRLEWQGIAVGVVEETVVVLVNFI